MSRFVDRICIAICSIMMWGRSSIWREFSNKAQQLRDDTKCDSEAIKRLEILTEEMCVKSKEIKSHEMLLGIATNNLDCPMWIKDLDGRFIFMNVACIEKILRTTPDHALLLTDEDFENDALAKVCVESDQVVLNTGMTTRVIEHARYDDGSDMWVDTTKSPWIVDGRIMGTVGFGREITDFVTEDVKEKYKKPGWFSIPIDLMYIPEDIAEIVSA